MGNDRATDLWIISAKQSDIENELPAEDAQPVDERRHFHEKARALRAHHEEHEERRSCECSAGFAAATPDQVRIAKHQLGGQQGATMDR